MIHIDGSKGEGGGQIVRSAIALSLLSGKPFTIENIRAKRKKPGLMRQHLTAVTAAEKIGGATTQGNHIGSENLRFQPGKVQPGKYRFSIGTAGSCTLVLQTILPPLLMASSSSELTIEGGTHNPMAPPFDFLQTTFLPILGKMGADVKADLEKPGFYPAGGGCMKVVISPTEELLPIHFSQLSPPRLSATAVCADLPEHIGERELKVAASKLGIKEENLKLVRMKGHGPGNFFSICIDTGEITESFCGFGQKNLRAEKVALLTIKEVKEFIQAKVMVGPYLADQLLIPMAMAGEGSFLTMKPTLHTLSNMEVIKNFVDVDFSITELGGDKYLIEVKKRKNHHTPLKKRSSLS